MTTARRHAHPRPRSRIRRVGALVIAVCLLGAACSVQSATPLPSCTEGGSGLIAAQSVPSATLLPCVGSLPDGWTADAVDVNQDRTIIRFDSDRAGEDAAVLRFTESCDIGPAVSTPSDHDGAQRFDDIQRLQPSFKARRLYVFEGGCVTWLFDFDRGVSATQSVAIGDSLTLVPRQLVNDQLRATFVDEEL